MKTKNRLLLSSALLLGLVAVSGTTATYAWFTVGMSQDAKVSNITASAGSDLVVSFAVGNGVITVGDDGVSLGWKTTSDGDPVGLTDITSTPDLAATSGSTIWKKAKFNSDGAVSSLKDITNVGAEFTTNTYYAATFNATVKFSGSVNDDQTFKVYLSGDSSKGMISAPDGASSANIIKATRVYVENSSESRKVVYTGSASSGKVTTMSGSTSTTTDYTSPVKVVTADNAKSQDGSVENQQVGIMNKDNSWIVNLSFTVFIEGTDSVNDILTNKEKAELNFHFYAIEQ